MRELSATTSHRLELRAVQSGWDATAESKPTIRGVPLGIDKGAQTSLSTVTQVRKLLFEIQSESFLFAQVASSYIKS